MAGKDISREGTLSKGLEAERNRVYLDTRISLKQNMWYRVAGSSYVGEKIGQVF